MPSKFPRKLLMLILMFLLAATAAAQSASSPDQDANDDRDATVVVNVWAPVPATASKPKQPDAARLSRDFARVALQAAMRMKEMQNTLRFVVEHGYPVEGYSVMRDRERAEDSLRLAALSASSEADRTALQELTTQYNNLQQWSDWLVEAYRTMRLGEYCTSPSTLEKDELFGKIASCSQSLIPMFASGRLAEENACR